MFSEECAMTTVAAPPAKPKSKPPNLAPFSLRTRIAVAAAFVVVIAFAALTRPRLGLIVHASPVIQIHLYAALAALGLGAVLLTSRKGRTFHRVAGWIWSGLMMIVAGVSLFITEIIPGHWSLIHILSATALITVPIGVALARRHNVRAHRRMMTIIYVSALVITGGFTFVPGRLMWMVFFGH
jgi:uncharacterized membrane protein